VILVTRSIADELFTKANEYELQVQMCHALLDEVLLPVRELFEDVQRKALMRLEYEGLNQADEIASPGGRYFKDPAGFAMDRYAYYVCFKCKKVQQTILPRLLKLCLHFSFIFLKLVSGLLRRRSTM